jgi:hypothetical protein
VTGHAQGEQPEIKGKELPARGRASDFAHRQIERFARLERQPPEQPPGLCGGSRFSAVIPWSGAMGTWPRRTYVQYVETHAQGRDIVPPQYPYDEALDAKNPNIFLSSFSMPLWMDTLDIAFDDRDATFRHTYRAAATPHSSLTPADNPLNDLTTRNFCSKDRGHLSLLPTSTPEAWGTK